MTGPDEAAPRAVPAAAVPSPPAPAPSPSGAGRRWLWLIPAFALPVLAPLLAVVFAPEALARLAFRLALDRAGLNSATYELVSVGRGETRLRAISIMPGLTADALTLRYSLPRLWTGALPDMELFRPRIDLDRLLPARAEARAKEGDPAASAGVPEVPPLCLSLREGKLTGMLAGISLDLALDGALPGLCPDGTVTAIGAVRAQDDALAAAMGSGPVRVSSRFSTAAVAAAALSGRAASGVSIAIDVTAEGAHALAASGTAEFWSADGSPAARAALDLSLRSQDLALPGLQLAGTLATLPLQLILDEGAFAAQLRGDGAITIAAVNAPAAGLAMTDLALAVQADGTELRIEPDGHVAAARLALTPAPMTGTGVRFPALTATLLPTTAPGGSAGLLFAARGDLPDLATADPAGLGRLRLSELDGEALIVAGRVAAVALQRLRVESLSAANMPAPFGPMEVNGSLKVDRGAAAYTGSMTIRPAGRSPALRAALTIPGDSRPLLAQLTLPPLTLEAEGTAAAGRPDAIPLAALSPRLADRFRSVSGTVSFTGALSLSARGLRLPGRLTFSDLGFQTEGVTVKGLTGTLAFADLLVPETAAPQRVSALKIEAGVSLSAPEAELSFDSRGVTIHSANASVAGGRVDLAAGRIGLADGSLDLPLRLSGVDLGQLMGMAPVPDLSIDGRLSGTLPVTGGRDRAGVFGWAIAEGRVAADAPGQIRYRPTSIPSGLDVVAEAFSAFNYQALSAGIERSRDGETLIALKVLGGNPNFYGGYPVELNFNLTGRVDEVIRRGMAGWRVPTLLQQKLQPRQGLQQKPLTK